MSTRKKLLILGLAAVALVALLLLAGSLSDLELQPGKPLALQFGAMERGYGSYSGEGALLLLTIMRILIIVLLPFSIIYLIISPEARKRALRTAIMLAVVTFLLSYFISKNPDFLQMSEGALQGLSPLEAPPLGGEAPEFVPGDTRNLVNILSLAIAVVLALILLGVGWVLWRRRRQPEESALVQLVQEAQDALDDIRSGGDLKNAVIRCYVEMSQVLSEQRGIQRGVTMTTREFENRLVQEGLPETSVRQLTRLFEDVRYGAQDPGLAEEQRAVQCLTAIVTAAAKTA